MLSGFAVTTVLLIIASALTVGWSRTVRYPAMLLHLSRVQTHLTMNPAFMPNLRGVLDRLLGGGSLTNTILIVVSAALVLSAARRCRLDPGRPIFPMEFSLAVSISLLASYHLGVQDFVVLLLPLLLASEALFEHSIHPPARNIVVISVALMLFSPVFLLLALKRWHVLGLFCVLALLVIGLAKAITQSKVDSRDLRITQPELEDADRAKTVNRAQ